MSNALTILNFLSFYGKSGLQLIDALDLTKMANYTLGASNGVIAQAGGAQAGAPQLSYGANEVLTVATTNDSVMLPPAIPGTSVTINNMGANTLRIYANSAITQGAAVADVMIAKTTTATTANGTAITIATGHATVFTCTTLGQFKQLFDV